MAAFNDSQTPHEWFASIIERGTSPDMRLELPSSNIRSSNPSQPAALVVAPMVDQSDLPFRKLARRYGSNLCYTPMIHSRLFLEHKRYFESFNLFVDEAKEDGPVFAQFCGNDPTIMAGAMKKFNTKFVDAVDINCGCPQGIARKGRYGAFLLEEGDLLVSIVENLVKELDCRVTIKVRILPTGIEDSLALYRRLVDAGVSLMTVHGRTRHQKGQLTGAVNWDHIKMVVDAIGDRIPVIANGGISNLDDIRRCLEVTGAAGVMSSEGVLEYPPIFSETDTAATEGKRKGPGRLAIAREYVDLEEKYPNKQGGQASGMKCAKSHVQHFLFEDLQSGGDTADEARKKLHCSKSVADMREVIDILERLQVERGHKVEEEKLGWYMRHRKEGEDDKETKLDIPQVELGDDFSGCFGGMIGEIGECGGDGDY